MKKIIKNQLLVLATLTIGILVYHFFFNKERTIIKEVIIENQEPTPQVYNTLFPTEYNGSTAPSFDFTYATDQTIHSVVHINTIVVQTQTYRDPMMEYFFGPDAGLRQRQYKGSGSGSGVILTDDGYIVTNNHVIDNAKEIKVTLNNNSEYEAVVIGTDPSTDLALIKIDAEKLSPVKMGNSNDVKVGEWVLAVGNPFNLTSTVTAGIVSAKGRNINIIRSNNQDDAYPIESFIQTDAAVNPGNSGGALVNIKGELIGINTAIASGTGYYTGYSFAIPVNLMQKVIGDLKDFGSVKRAVLGVQIRDIDQKLMEEVSISNTNGVYIEEVQNHSAAEKYGIKKGDVITHIDNVKINSTPKLMEEIGKKSPNETISINIIRDHKERMIKVTLKGMEESSLFTENKIEISNNLGVHLRDVDSKELKELELKNGVKVMKVLPGKLLAAGVPKGFIITKVDNIDVKDAKTLGEYLQKKKGGLLIEGLLPSGEKAFFGLGI